MRELHKRNFTSAVAGQGGRGAFEHPVHERFHNAGYGSKEMHHAPHFNHHDLDTHKNSIVHHPYVQEFLHQSGWEKITSICTAALAMSTVFIMFVVFFMQIFG